MDYRTPGFPVLHYLLEFAPTHIHWVHNTNQPSYPLSSFLLLPSVFPSIRVFSIELAPCIGGQSIGASALVIVLPKNIQGWLVWSPCCLRNSQASSPASQFKSNSSALSLLYGSTLISIYDYWEKTIILTIQTFVRKAMSLLFNRLSRFVIAFLPRSKHLLILWLKSISAVILESKKIKSSTVYTFSPSIAVKQWDQVAWS